MFPVDEDNATENAAKEGFAAWKMYSIIGAVAGVVIIGVVALIIFICKKKKTKDELGFSPIVNENKDKKDELGFSPIVNKDENEDKNLPLLPPLNQGFIPLSPSANESLSDKKTKVISHNLITIVSSESFGDEEASRLQKFINGCYTEGYVYKKEDLENIDVDKFTVDNVKVNSEAYMANEQVCGLILDFIEDVKALKTEDDANEIITTFKDDVEGLISRGETYEELQKELRKTPKLVSIDSSLNDYADSGIKTELTTEANFSKE